MITDKIWICKDISDEAVCELANKASISTLLAKVFLSRGINDIDYIKRCIAPSFENLHDPFLLNDMDKAVCRIMDALSSKEKILIYADYDVDGVTSATVLFNFLKRLGGNLDYFIPDRLTDGYGLTLSSANKVIKSEPELIITLDCGISSINEVDYINENNIDIIITDHHECIDTLPDALAVINPKRPDSRYPFKELAGVGVCFKLINALSIKMDLGDIYFDYIDLVTIGTVADVVPLVDENRIIVSYGLKKLKETSNIGLDELLKSSNPKDVEVTSWTIAFVIAPRINAAGRLGDASRGFRLFTTSSRNEAIQIVEELNNENKTRQDIEAVIVDQAIQILEDDDSYKKKKVLVLAGEGWHHGVIGIVASKITERFYKPCILLAIEDGICKGSGRSIEGFDVFMALSSCEGLLQRYGGHEMAGGLTLSLENLEKFDKMINEYADKVLTYKDLQPRLKVDVKLNKKEINMKSIREVELLAPFGAGNSSPLFLLEDIKIRDIRTVGNGKHLKMTVEDEGSKYDAIGFGKGELESIFQQGDLTDVACMIEINSWNGTEKVQLNIKDMRYGHEELLKHMYFYSLDKCFCYKNEGYGDKYINIQKNNVPYMMEMEYNEEKLIQLINDKRSLVILNSLKSIKKFKLFFAMNSSCIKKQINIVYTCLYEYMDDSIDVIINPDIDNVHVNKFDFVILFGSFIDKEYRDQIILKAQSMERPCICMMDDEESFRDQVIPKRQDLEVVYRYLKASCQNTMLIENIFVLTRKIINSYKIGLNYFKLKKIIDIFSELGFFNVRYKDKCVVEISSTNDIGKKTSLENSSLYKKLQNI